MDFIRRNLIRTTALVVALAAGALSASAQPAGGGSIRGQVTDELGGAVVGASVTAADADALVLRDKDLDALPEDPDELAAALQALAGPSGGPNGGQIFVDGFSGGRMPSRDTIREVRINQNPFTAENDRPGFGGRIEILPRPGTDKFRGRTYFTFMDESFNSRN